LLPESQPWGTKISESANKTAETLNATKSSPKGKEKSRTSVKTKEKRPARGGNLSSEKKKRPK